MYTDRNTHSASLVKDEASSSAVELHRHRLLLEPFKVSGALNHQKNKSNMATTTQPGCRAQRLQSKSYSWYLYLLSQGRLITGV